jgi:hypothetical protein
MIKLTKVEQYKVEDIIGQIYAGVVMQLDPTGQDSQYKTISSRLSEDLKELKEALNLK